MSRHAEGEEQLVIQPYLLKAAKKFGFLVDFHFRLKQGVPFSKRIQQLSLSLDQKFRRNLDYYADRHAKISKFVCDKWPVFENLKLPGDLQIRVSKDFEKAPADRLRSRVYVFDGNKESRSQFLGLKDNGPLRSLEQAPKLVFVFREPDRPAARTLAMALRGT